MSYSGHNNRSNLQLEQLISNNPSQLSETTQHTENTSGPFPQTAPRAGVVVVESYGTLVGNQSTAVSPLKALLAYCNGLKSFASSSKHRQEIFLAELVATFELITADSQLLDSEIVEQISGIVDQEANLRSSQEAKKLKTLLANLPSRSSQNKSTSMDPNRPTGRIPSLLGGVPASFQGVNSPSNAAQVLADLGPSSTRSAATFRQVLAEIGRTQGPIEELAIASIIYLFSSKVTGRETSTGVTGLSSALLGSLIDSRGSDASGSDWNIAAVAQVIREDYGNLDWVRVVGGWDTPDFHISDPNQLRLLFEIYQAGAKEVPPFRCFVVQWRNPVTQLSLIETLAIIPQSVYPIPLDKEELLDVGTASSSMNPSPNPQVWASSELLQRMLSLSDIPALYRRVRDLFYKCLMACPEVLFCSLVRLQLRMSSSGSGSANVGMQIKSELMRELIPLFFRPSRPVQNGPAALRRLYSLSPSTVMAACFEAWRSAAQESPQVRLAGIIHIIQIARLLPAPTEAIATLLSGSKDAEYSISIAFVMADNDYLQLKPWLGEKLTSSASVGNFSIALLSYLRKTYAAASTRSGGSDGPLVSLENMAVSLQLIQALDVSVLRQSSQSMSGTLVDNVNSMIELCIGAHPSLRSAFNFQGGGSSLNSRAQSTASEDVEEMATAYFKRIYTSENSIAEVVEMLKRFKTSENPKENEICSCMVQNLFNDYRFFARYPEKELRITGIFFGALIQEQLVSSLTLGVGLRYVLEALRQPPSPPGVSNSSGNMFKFGMFALEQFKGRLHEWPQYCSHIVSIPHLKEGYAGLVAEIEQQRNQGAGAASVSGNSTVSQTSTEGNISRDVSVASAEVPQADGSAQDGVVVGRTEAVFGPGLGRAVTDISDEELEFDAPPDVVLDKVQFLVNNLAPSNVDQKALELRKLLDREYFGWLGHFLVVKRISTQANFHSLYLSLLDALGDYGKGLVKAILASAYHNIGKLLRSPKITTSTSERSYLKNLGIWLGQITLARNRPILQVMLDCKELLLQGYETGNLIAVAPFLAKTLEGAKNSIIFRPPNPWIMSILSVFRSVYSVQGLKMNIKFEVEVLCKNLNIRLEDIPVNASLLDSRTMPPKEKNPDFNVRAGSIQRPSRSTEASPDGSSLRVPPNVATHAADQQDTVIPNLASYVTVNPNLPQLLQNQTGGGSNLASLVTLPSLKRWVPLAVDRAIREIIQPVVERSVTIACITTKEIVCKDFAMESDENKMRKGGQLMVANLAGSLALVTCREPLRSSVSTHLRQLLTSSIGQTDDLSEAEQNAIEQCVQVCSTDNLELGCRLIEKAATEKAVRDIDEALATAMNARRSSREQTGQQFFDMSIFTNGNRYPAALPDLLRPQPGGLRAEHFQLYEGFQRLSRQSSGSGPLRPASPHVGGIPSGHEENVEQGRPLSSQPWNTDVLATIVSKLDSVVTSLLAPLGPRASQVKLNMLSSDHQIKQLLQAIKQVMPNSSQSGQMERPLSQTERELILGFSQGVFKRLYELSLSEPLRLEVLVAVLECINTLCPKLGKDMGTWATYAPTNTDVQRRLHKTVLLLLVRSRLLSVHDLDAFLAARADNGRNQIWFEFSLFFIRTAFMENISKASDFPKLIELMTKVAEDRSLASPQLVQTYRKSIVDMLKDTRADHTTDKASLVPASEPNVIELSSLSRESILRITRAPKAVTVTVQLSMDRDPKDSVQQVSTLLDSWIRVYDDPMTCMKTRAQFISVLREYGVSKAEEPTERFLRISTLTMIDATLKSAQSVPGSGNSQLIFTYVDILSALFELVFERLNSGGSDDQIDAERLGILNRILGTIVRTMMWHSETWRTRRPGVPWDQRPWFRLVSNLVFDLNRPKPAFDKIRLGMLSAFGAAFHCCQPLAFGVFSVSWLSLISHRHFLPNVMLHEDKKGWHILHELLIDVFVFLEPYLKSPNLAPQVKKYYEGTLRVMLVLLHDFPAFLASYHVSLCNMIPDTCVQLRNVVLSATPKGLNPPDPFTPNLQIDTLKEVSQSPTVLSNISGPIEGLKAGLDAFLADTQNRTFLMRLPQLLCASTSQMDHKRVNALMVYIASHALARMQKSQTLSRTPEVEIVMRLMECDDRSRYICLSAIANQLRYPSSHTHYFSCLMLYIFSESASLVVKEQVTRVLLERLIVNRPHPWGLLVTFVELIKNQRYNFWSFPFTRCATEIEKVFESVARSCMPPGTQRGAVVGGEES